MTMALRVPMLLLLSGTFAGGVAATQIAPKVLPSAQSETSAEALTAVQSASAETASSPQPAKEVPAPTQCNRAAWPYVDPGCTGSGDATGAQPERQVRIISTNRDAPSRVTIPTPVRATAEKVQVTALSEPSTASEQSATSSQPASVDDGTNAAHIAILPPEKPDLASSGQEKAAQADSSKKPASANERVETTASIRPAAQPAVAKERAPARRQVARAEHRRDLSERIRQARQNFDAQDDAVVQTTTYRYADGRQIVFRSEPHRSDRRRWAAEEPIEQAPPVEFRPVRPANDTILGWLFQ
jgi:hypothetical protein